MNISISRLLSLMLVFVPITAGAQNSIKSAFDAIIKCPEAKVKENLSLDKDPSTGKKTGQCDVYNFELPASKAKLIKDVYSAFENEAEKAYDISRGKYRNVNREESLAVGNGRGKLRLNYPADCEYIISLFLAPKSEDPDGIHRYAYAMTYNETDGKFVGRLIITYATTLMYRQQLEKEKENEIISNWTNGTYNNRGNTQNNSKKTWFDRVMSYLQGMSSASTQTRIALASNAYKAIRDISQYPDVTQADKETIGEILKGMIADKEYSETVLNTLLKQCLGSIK